MEILRGKRLLIGITGSVAAYKSAELVRLLRSRGAAVRVAMTREATRFITPLTMRAVSGQEVCVQDEAAAGHGMDHIELARWCDAALIAPATADFLARIAHGHANDLLSALCLALRAPLLAAPAMNSSMWAHPATRENVALLSGREVRFWGPASGPQACGETGTGRMLEPAELVARLSQFFATGRLSGRSVLVTAGPTWEPIDPVRYLGNRSSGHMGYAIARAAAEGGAGVTLISGPVALQRPERMHCLEITTAEELRRAALAEAGRHDIFVSAAAVADYRCRIARQEKLKKGGELCLRLEPNPDVLAAVAQLDPPPFLVGFAAETERVAENARGKLRQKRLDMIVANQVGWEQGFGDRESELEVFWDGGHVRLDKGPKDRLARQLVGIVADRYDARHPH